MEDELRLSLLVAGSCFIIAVLAHGIWKIRKNNQAASPKREEPRVWHDDDDEESPQEHDSDAASLSRGSPYDDLGLGEVRVVNSAGDAPSRSADADTRVDTDEWVDTDDDEQTGVSDSDDQPQREAADSAATESSSDPEPQEEKLYGSVVSNPKPHMQAQTTASHQEQPHEFPEPPGFLIKDTPESASDTQDNATPDKSDVDSFSLDTQSAPPSENDDNQSGSLGEQAKRMVSRKRVKSAPQKRRQEPNFGDDQMRIDFDEADNNAEVRATQASVSEQKPHAQPAEQEVLVLNVKSKADEPISGAALLPLLLTLGFKYGEQDIFHRHVNSNGKGPVLFSLANMFKPGNFDIDNLENFTTQGVSLFMILPIEGDPHQVFNMMHNAGRKIADEFGAQLLDGRRSVLTKQGLQQYNEKIREFERQRMIARH